MKLISKLLYQARRNGLDIEKNDGEVKLMNFTTKKYLKILPNGKICSNDILNHDHDLKYLMNDFLIKDPFSGSSICLPCSVSLHVGKDTDQRDIIYAKHCLNQCFGNIKNFEVITDNNLLSSECMIKHNYVLSYKERQAFIKACMKYLE